MSKLGALKKVAEWAEQSTEPLRRQVMDITENLLTDPGALSKVDRKTLLDYLRGVGGKQEWKDMFPGATFTRMGDDAPPPQIRAPGAKEMWYRGGPSAARLPEKGPIFTTRQSEGAAWYATERSGNPYMLGAITEYVIDAKNPARQRDMLDLLASEPSLARETAWAVSDPYNVWDRLYTPEFSKRLQGRGFDSALGYDVLDRDDIEALIALDKGQMQPIQRRLVVPEGSLAAERARKPLYNLDDNGNYVQIGKPHPFSRKAKGGLIQMKECNCK